MNGYTGTWSERSMGIAAEFLGGFIRFVDINGWWFKPAIAIGAMAVAAYCLYLIVSAAVDYSLKGAKYLSWRARGIGIRAYHIVRKSKPVGIVMQKWKKTVVGDYLYDAILTMEVKGVIDAKESKQLQSVIAEACGFPELLPRRLHKLFVRAYWMGTAHEPPIYQKLTGPKGTIPGGPPSLHIPEVENIIPQSRFLQKLRDRRAA